MRFSSVSDSWVHTGNDDLELRGPSLPLDTMPQEGSATLYILLFGVVEANIFCVCEREWERHYWGKCSEPVGTQLQQIIIKWSRTSGTVQHMENIQYVNTWRVKTLKCNAKFEVQFSVHEALEHHAPSKQSREAVNGRASLTVAWIQVLFIQPAVCWRICLFSEDFCAGSL